MSQVFTSNKLVSKTLKKFAAQTDNNHITPVRLIRKFQFSTSVGGVLNSTIGLDPSGCSEWGSYSGLYDEFRVVAIRVSLLPVQQGSVTAINNLIGMVFDNDNSSALTSTNQALEYDTAVKLSSVWYANKPSLPEYSWARPNAGRNTAITWCDVAVPAGSVGSVKFYGDSLTASLAYIDAIAEYFVEFRGRI